MAGLFAGAVVFTALSALLDHWAQPGPASAGGAAGLALLAAVTLDGVPENVALGVSLTEGTGGLALLAEILVSNLPESPVGEASMREQGMSKGRAVLLWTVCAVLLVVAVLIGAAR